MNLEKAKPILTKRQIDCLRLLADGMTDDHVATRIGISRNTVMGYKKTIKEELNTRNVTHSVAVAIRAGLI